MNKYELGNEFKENIERLPSLSLKQKVELLENLANEAGDNDIEIVKAIVRTKSVFDLFIRNNKDFKEKTKIKAEINRLQKFFNQDQILDLCEFMSAFDPFYSEVKEGILKPSEELETMKVDSKTRDNESLENNSFEKINKNEVLDKLKKFGGSLGGILGFIFLFIFKEIVKSNLYFWLRISKTELSVGAAKLLILGSWFFAALFIISYSYLVIDVFSIAEQTTESSLKGYQRRRKTSKPWLVGVLVGALSPLLFAIIYSIRHKDWRLFLYPLWTYFSLSFLVIPVAIDSTYVKIISQISSGLIAYLIVRKNKITLKQINIEV